MLLFRLCPVTMRPSEDLNLEGARVNNEDGLARLVAVQMPRHCALWIDFEGTVNRIP